MAAPPPPAPQVNPLARTTFQLVGGTPATHVEARWTLPRDSSVVDSLSFIDWDIPVAGRASAPRSQLVGAILMACRAPVAAELTLLHAKSFLLHEMDMDVASDYLHVLDDVQAFDRTYPKADEWISEMPALWGAIQNLDHIRLTDAAYVETENYATRQQVLPAELEIFNFASIGTLVELESTINPSTGLLSLARATVVAGSKDTRAERDDETSPVRLGAERLKSLALRAMHRATASGPGLARQFCALMGRLHLPKVFASTVTSRLHATDELEAAYDYAHGTASEAREIERARILRAGGVHANLQPVLDRFADAGLAYVEVERLMAALLPASLATSTMLARLSALNDRLDISSST